MTMIERIENLPVGKETDDLIASILYPDGHYFAIFNPSESMEHAWQLFKKFKYAELEKINTLFRVSYFGSIFVQATAGTAPLAISRAFLMDYYYRSGEKLVV